MPTQPLLVFLLGAAGAGGLLWVFVYPFLSGERPGGEAQSERSAAGARGPRGELAQQREVPA